MSSYCSPSGPFLRALLLSLLLTLCHANLMAVDLGLGYVKVAVARPGKGLELVINEQAKRKTPAAVAFTDEGERLFGDAAVAYAAKAPARAILDGRILVGQCAEERATDSTVTDPCERVRRDVSDAGKFSGEEVVAMLLAMARRQAGVALGGFVVKDVAVTVPEWFDERERQAIRDAAQVAGLNCLGVVNGNTAAAIKYALDGKGKPTEDAVAAAKAAEKKGRTPKTITQRVMFYNMGASSATASIAEVTSDVKTGAATAVKMVGHAWEKGVGGKVLDEMVVKRLADAFDEQRGKGATSSYELPRVMMRLRKEAQRVREVLSANMETMVSVGSLHDDVDLRTTVSRADFEKDAASLFSLVGGPAKAVLSKAKLKAADLAAVVPFGGASRTPRVQEELCKAVGIESLNKSINTDEAAVMGTAFFAASVSSTFRVRKLDVEDVYPRAVSVEIEKENSSGGLFAGKKKNVQKVQVFSEDAAKMPSKKTLSLNRKEDFSLDVYLDADKYGVERFPGRAMYAKANVKGVGDVLKKLKDPSKAKSLTPRVALTFQIDKGGLVRIGTAESSVDESVVVERTVEVKSDKEDKPSKTMSPQNTDDEQKSSTRDKKDEEASESTGSPADEEGSAEKGDSAGSKDKKEEGPETKPAKKTRVEKSTQTVVHRQSLLVEYDAEIGIMGMQLSKKDLTAAKKLLSDLEAADLERAARADALNALEGYILAVRSAVRGAEEGDDLYVVSTEDEREKLVAVFDESEDWLYTDDAKQTANLRKKHHELSKLFEPMEQRATELRSRPEALEALSKALNSSLEKVAELRKARGEEAGLSKSFDEFTAFCESTQKWISDAVTRQKDRALTEAPVVTLAEITAKQGPLKKAIEKLMKALPTPSAAPSASAEGEKGDTNNSEEKVNSTSGEAPNAPLIGEDVMGAGEDGPTEPGSAAGQADSASGVSPKDEL